MVIWNCVWQRQSQSITKSSLVGSYYNTKFNVRMYVATWKHRKYAADVEVALAMAVEQTAYFNCQKGIMYFVWTSEQALPWWTSALEPWTMRGTERMVASNAAISFSIPTHAALLRLRRESIVFITGGGSNRCWTKAWIFHTSHLDTHLLLARYGVHQIQFKNEHICLTLLCCSTTTIHITYNCLPIEK